MAERKNYKEGEFCWNDLMTTDQKRATLFYSKVFGWEFEDLPTDRNSTYTMFKHQGKKVCALMQMPEEMQKQNIPSHWQSYISVKDINETFQKAKELGATAACEPFPIMQSGHMATLMDPEGAPFNLWQPVEHFGAEWVNHPGGICWNEKLTHDKQKSFDFYNKLFGWDFERSQGDGEYYEFKLSGRTSGAHLPATEEMKNLPSHWAIYFSVENFEETQKRIEENEGKILMPPVDIPVGKFSVAMDPMGATFYFMQMKVIDD